MRWSAQDTDQQIALHSRNWYTLILLCFLHCHIVTYSCLFWRQVLGAGLLNQCRYGYPNVEALEDVVSKYASNKVTPHIDIHSPTHPPIHSLTYVQIPLDTMWTDIDYMDGVSILLQQKYDNSFMLHSTRILHWTPNYFPADKMNSFVSQLLRMGSITV